MGTIEYAKKQKRLPEFGTPVKTVLDKNTITESFFVKQKHIDCRKNTAGRYTGYVPGAGGDVWWIEHKDENVVGAYCLNEVFDR